MKIRDIKLENYTVFKDTFIQFNDGINVLVGENATGKTHLMKLLYSACCATREDTDFGQKLVRTMLPDGFRISRLVTRGRGGSHTKIDIHAVAYRFPVERMLTVEFNIRTPKWYAYVPGKAAWEKAFYDNDNSCTYIPAKEILSHSYNLNAAASKGNVIFDDTYLDIINSAKVDISTGRDYKARNILLKKIEAMIKGKVVYDVQKDEFYLTQGRSKQEFNIVAEGIKKMGLLWLLAKNGTLESGSILFWDEPESNINPSFIGIIADILLELQRNGVQIFLATHNYFLAKYLDIKKSENDQIAFYSLYKVNDADGIKCESNTEFTLLENNPIVKTYLQIYRDEIGVKFE